MARGRYLSLRDEGQVLLDREILILRQVCSLVRRVCQSAFVRRAELPLAALACATAFCNAQDLSPRAYVITPVNGNAITLTYSFNSGDVLFDPAIPITGAKGQINSAVATYYYSGDFFSRSFNVTASLPYAIGYFNGMVGQNPNQVSLYRSGLLDSVYRFSVNLKGGPAMKAPEFIRWRQKLLIGASLKVVAPSGQYDPARLINQGSNRWAFKPEIGLSRRWGKIVLDTYAAVWFFTENSAFYPAGQNYLTQRPTGAFEGHLSYDWKRRLWFSLDGNYWVGGRSVVNGVVNYRSFQNNSRIGATASFPIGKHQSLKVSYSDGAYIVYGGDYQTVSVAWQYSWLGTKFRD
jgi:hypothetical protein